MATSEHFDGGGSLCTRDTYRSGRSIIVRNRLFPRILVLIISVTVMAVPDVRCDWSLSHLVWERKVSCFFLLLESCHSRCSPAVLIYKIDGRRVVKWERVAVNRMPSLCGLVLKSLPLIHSNYGQIAANETEKGALRRICLSNSILKYSKFFKKSSWSFK